MLYMIKRKWHCQSLQLSSRRLASLDLDQRLSVDEHATALAKSCNYGIIFVQQNTLIILWPSPWFRF